MTQINVDNSFSYFLPLSKVEKQKDGTCLVSGYATTPALDLDDERISLDAVKKALPGYWQYRNIRQMHQSSAVGVGKEYNIDDKGLFLTAKIVDKDAVEKCLEGVYKGFSIGGRKLAKTGNLITEIEWIETSIVDRPANPECRFDVAKAAKPDVGAYLVRLQKPFRDPKDKALAKMAQAVEVLTKGNPPAANDGFSLPAKTTKSEDKPIVDDTKPSVRENLCKHGNPSDTCAKCMKRAAKKEAKKVEKREFSSKERERLAGTGAAMPDGSFPISNEQDLKNAIRAIGRAKDPGKAKSHIKSRAKSMGLTNLLPDDWKTANVVSKSAQPSFLTLGADTTIRKSGIESSVGLGHGLDLTKQERGTFSNKEMKLLKRMGVAGSLAYCFDSIRNAQRDLLFEAKREGGDMKDKALADKLGNIAKDLAAVIGQKALHEGEEALDFSDADDQGVGDFLEDLNMSANVNANDVEALVKAIMKGNRPMSKAKRVDMARGDMKKARKAAKDAEDCIKAAHGMHKAAYLAKAAKKPKNDDDGDDFDHQGAMEKLQTAFGKVQMLKTLIKSANGQLKKAARSGQRGQEVNDGTTDYEVPMGVKDLSSDQMDTAGGSGAPFVHGMEAPFPKAAKITNRLVKQGFISAEHAQAIAEAAAAKAENELLKAMPGTPTFGRRPVAFDTTAFGDKTAAGSILKGVDLNKLKNGDENQNRDEISKMIGNMILGGHGKSVLDPNFHGTAV